jgi:hypothetical protein
MKKLEMISTTGTEECNTLYFSNEYSALNRSKESIICTRDVLRPSIRRKYLSIHNRVLSFLSAQDLCGQEGFKGLTRTE